MLAHRPCCRTYTDEPHEEGCPQSRRNLLKAVIAGTYQPSERELVWMAERLLELLPIDVLDGGY